MLCRRPAGAPGRQPPCRWSRLVHMVSIFRCNPDPAPFLRDHVVCGVPSTAHAQGAVRRHGLLHFPILGTGRPRSRVFNFQAWGFCELRASTTGNRKCAARCLGRDICGVCICIGYAHTSTADMTRQLFASSKAWRSRDAAR